MKKIVLLSLLSTLSSIASAEVITCELVQAKAVKGESAKVQGPGAGEINAIIGSGPAVTKKFILNTEIKTLENGTRYMEMRDYPAKVRKVFLEPVLVTDRSTGKVIGEVVAPVAITNTASEIVISDSDEVEEVRYELNLVDNTLVYKYRRAYMFALPKRTVKKAKYICTTR